MAMFLGDLVNEELTGCHGNATEIAIPACSVPQRRQKCPSLLGTQLFQKGSLTVCFFFCGEISLSCSPPEGLWQPGKHTVLKRISHPWS